MKKRLIIPIGLVALLTVGFLGLNSNTFSKPNDIPVVESHASWVKYYPDIKSLVEGADVIVEGEAQAINTFARHDEADIATYVTFKVVKWYKGSDIKTREQITVVQDGGIYKGVNHKLDKVEIMEPGKKYLLFLRYAPEVDRYVVLTGWQGQFKLGLIKAENPEAKRSVDKDELYKEVAKFKN
ncbi:MAG: hypothetical protein M0021_00640 [Clostridia bacterium]|nr:hypothetical protein [Clostridia bacterium]